MSVGVVIPVSADSADPSLRRRDLIKKTLTFETRCRWRDVTMDTFASLKRLQAEPHRGISGERDNFMAKTSSPVIATCLAVSLLVVAQSEDSLLRAREVPDFGLMFNNDGDRSFASSDPQEATQKLQAAIDSLADAPVKTLMYSVASGSDILNYPTKVSSVWGWRKTRHDNDPKFQARITNGRACIGAGMDGPRVAGEQANRLGIAFVPSLRMNDSHFAVDPFESPLTGEFWLENHKRLTIGVSGESPWQEEKANLFDFSHKEVRHYRLAVLFEMIDRYQDIMAGIEMDFNRVQVLFPKGTADERSHLVTDMLADVRQRLDEVGKKNGKDYYLLVRVPPTPKNCRWAGLDIQEWMDNRLVDVLIPAQLMSLSHDMPIHEFVSICEPAGCKVYPALYPRTGYMWPFTPNPSDSTYTTSPTRRATPQLLAGAAANYWYNGAEGMQLFNFGFTKSDWKDQLMQSIAAPLAVKKVNRTYAVTPAYHQDYLNLHQYRKQLPADLIQREPQVFTLNVGENLSDTSTDPTPHYCAVRLGFRNARNELPIKVELNGVEIHSGSNADGLIRAPGGDKTDWSYYTPPPTLVLQLPIDDLTLVKQGVNTLTVTIGYPRGPVNVSLVMAQIGVVQERNR